MLINWPILEKLLKIHQDGQMYPHLFRPGLTETDISQYSDTHLFPRAEAAGPGWATQAAIDSKSLAAKQTKGSSIILAVLALRPASLLSSLLASPRPIFGGHPLKGNSGDVMELSALPASLHFSEAGGWG